MNQETGWLIGAVLAASVAASTASGSAERDAVFQRLLDDPANTSLMLQYARLSVAEKDYEAAVGTLERLVRDNPTSQEARLELAIAYFALGQDEVARYHLEIYRERADLSAAEAELAERYIANLERRGQKLKFAGFAEAGAFSQSQNDESGFMYDLAVTATYDLGGQNATSWDTLLRYRGVSFYEDSTLNEQVLQLRTGPILSLDGTTFGPRVQPYLELSDVSVDDDAAEAFSFGFGVGYTQILDGGGSLDADAQIGKIDRAGFGIDSTYRSLRVGRTFQLDEMSSFGVSLRYLDEVFDSGDADRERIGVRVGARRNLDLEIAGLRDISVSGFVRADFESLSFGRDDDILGAGASVRAYFRPGSYVNASVSKFNRSSTDPVFDSRDTVVTLIAGLEF